MSDLPPEMLQGDRRPDSHFGAQERLYRRFTPDMLSDGELELDAVELPDMSVTRGKYGKPQWLLLDEEVNEWGVLSFLVEDIPGELLHRGVRTYTFKPVHRPQKRNYPHSKIWAYENGRHIDGKAVLDPEVHLRWRLMLLRKTRISIRPSKTSRP